MVKIEYRFGLTGTPITKTPIDLHGILKTLTNHPIGEFSKFEMEKLLGYKQADSLLRNITEKSIWYRPFKMYEIKSFEDIYKIIDSKFFYNLLWSKYGVNKDNLSLLNERQITWLLQEIKKYKVTLPSVNRVVVEIPQNNLFCEEYDAIMQKSKTIQVDSKTINTAMMNLYVMHSQMKMDYVFNYIVANQHKKIVVMSSFTNHFIYPLRERLEKAGIKVRVFTGDQTVLEKEKSKQEFIKDNTICTLLVSFSAGSTGLDSLQRVSNTLILANPVWTLSTTIQAIARIRRPFGAFDEMDLIIPYIKGSNAYPSIDEAMLNACAITKEKFNYYLTNDVELDVELADVLNQEQRKLMASIANKLK